MLAQHRCIPGGRAVLPGDQAGVVAMPVAGQLCVAPVPILRRDRRCPAGLDRPVDTRGTGSAMCRYPCPTPPELDLVGVRPLDGCCRPPANLVLSQSRCARIRTLKL